MKAAGVPDWYIGSCKKIKYLFPKAHAVAYVTMGLRIAYFKIYYPAAYYACYLMRNADAFDGSRMVTSNVDVLRSMIEGDQRPRALRVRGAQGRRGVHFSKSSSR